MAQLNLRTPNGYDGSLATDKKMGIMRFATSEEALAGTRNDVAITPLTAQAAASVDFASPPVLGFGSTTPRPVHATTLDSTSTTSLATGAGAVTNIGNATGTIGFFGVTAAARPAATADIKDGLALLGLLTNGGATPLNLDGGAFTAGTVTAATTVAAGTTVTAGTGVTATTGDITASTGNLVSTLGSVSAATTVTAGTSVTATLGAITATNGNFVKGTAGNKDIYSSVATDGTAGANSAGTVILASGEATIATTAVTANSIIRLYRQGVGATGAAALGILSILSKSAGVNFVIRAVQPADATAAQAADVSVVGWEIVN
jgi:hypothetical protein